MALFGSLGKWLGKGLGGLSKVSSAIPGVGAALGGAMGGIGQLFEKGDRVNFGDIAGGTAGGMLSGAAGSNSGIMGKLFGGGGGGGLGNILGLAGAGIGAHSIYQGNKQQNADRKQARQLAQESLSGFRDMRQGAENRYGLNSPMRDAFRSGIMNAQDPTNPFARSGMFDQFASRLQQESAPVQAQQQGLAGRIMGGRKLGQPTNRTASVKPGGSLRGRFGLDAGIDERDNQFQRFGQ